MINITTMIHKVVKIKNKDGDRLSAYLADIVDGKYLHLIFKSGLDAYLAIDDVLFISPAKRQPEKVVV